MIGILQHKYSFQPEIRPYFLQIQVNVRPYKAKPLLFIQISKICHLSYFGGVISNCHQSDTCHSNLLAMIQYELFIVKVER